VVIFQIRSCFYAWTGQQYNPLSYTSQVAGMTGAHSHTQLFNDWNGISWTFWLANIKQQSFWSPPLE
jgi:hypothetical protein